MDYVQLGRTGLKVSRLCLGTMNFGPETDEKDSFAIMSQALSLGINFFDTANVYSDGSSEEIVGRALRDFARRDEIVVATKGRFNDRKGPNLAGLSRKALFQQIDASLQRLGMDHVDLYQIHRWDPDTPIEETMEALHDIVKSGRARYVGASSMHAWQFAKAQHVAVVNRWTPFVSMQPELSLLYREEEREMLPLCADEGIAVIPWSPLARGRLTRPWDAETARTETDEFGRSLYRDEDRTIVERVLEVAKRVGARPAQVALAWMLGKDVVTAPIVGATKVEHLTDAVEAVDLQLSAEDVAHLEEPYRPHAVAGHV